MAKSEAYVKSTDVTPAAIPHFHSLTQSHEEAAFDAPDQAVWHAPTKTWFVSNLGGGISLEKDNYGWITQVDQSGNIIHPF